MRKLAIALFTATALIGSHSIALAQKAMTPQQYHQEKEPCACPDDKDKAGHRCGKRSAFCQAGGEAVTCFRTGNIAKRKKEACG